MSDNSIPWHRQFWPWFIMALPASAVVAGLTTLWIAIKHQDSVVRDDWYKDGKSINQSMARDDRAAQMKLQADVRVDAVTGDVLLRLQQAGGEPLAAATLQLVFSHPTQAAADQTVVLTPAADGAWRGHLAAPLTGRFYVELGTAEWRLTGTHEFPQESFRL